MIGEWLFIVGLMLALTSPPLLALVGLGLLFRSSRGWALWLLAWGLWGAIGTGLLLRAAATLQPQAWFAPLWVSACCAAVGFTASALAGGLLALLRLIWVNRGCVKLGLLKLAGRPPGAPGPAAPAPHIDA